MKPKQKMYDGLGNQVLLYPSTTVNITQSSNGNYSHMGVTSIDDNSGATDISQFYTPCDLKLVEIMSWSENPLIWQSLKPVRLADGSLENITIRTMHEDDISKYKIGDIYLQGDNWIKEGNAGNSTGNHVHLEVIKGHTTTLKQSAEGKWSLGLFGIDQNPDSYFFVNDTPVIRINNGAMLYFKEYDGSVRPPLKETDNILVAMISKAFPFGF